MRTIGIAFLAQLLAATAEWSGSSFSDGNFRVQSACSALLHGEMFTFGGRGFDNSVASPSFDYINQIWAYNVTSDTWRNASAAGAPTERWEASMVVVGSTLLIYGGDGPSYSGDLFSYDTTSSSWSELTPVGGVPPTRRAHAAVLDGVGRMWILGGYYSNIPQFDTWIYDVTGNSWSQAADGPFPLMYHSAVYEPFGTGMIWMFAGSPVGSGGWFSSKELWCLDIQANTWSNFTQPGGPGGRRSHVAVYAQSQGTRGTMWIHGGYYYDGSETKYSDVWSYEIAGSTWTEFTSISSMARYMHVAVFDSSTSVMWIYAGTWSSVMDLVDAYWTVPTTTTTTTGLPVNAAEALTSLETRQAQIAAALRSAASNVTGPDGVTLDETVEATSGSASLSKRLLAPASGLSFSYQGVTVELPGALLETLQDGFVLSLALIDSNSSLFEFFEAPPAVLASPMASVQLYTSDGLGVSQLAASLLVSFPRPTLEGRFRPQCVFWDEGLQAWSSAGVSLVSESADQVTCAAEHLSLLALLLMPFACSNAAAIFSQEGVDLLLDFSWAGRLPAVMTWFLLLVGLGFLILALWLDKRHQALRRMQLKRLETSELVKYTKKTSMELPEEKIQFHPATLKKILLNALHTKILISELGVDLAFLKQLYVTGGFSPVHAEAKALLEKFYGSSLLAKSVWLFRMHCSWLKFSHPMMQSTSLQRSAETLAKFWSGLALVALWYSSTALAAHQPADCDGVKGLLEMIVRGFVVSTVGAIVGLLPVLVLIIIQQKVMRKMGLAAVIVFWSFIVLYFLLSLFVVLVFIASVSSADGVDFLVGVLTAVLRTILVTPWLAVSFFLLVIASVEVDVASSLPFQSVSKETGRFLRVDVESLSLTSQESGRSFCFKCQVSGFEHVITVKEQDADAPGVSFTGLAEHHLLLLSVYESKEQNDSSTKLSLFGAAAVLAGELEKSQELPLQCHGQTLEPMLRLTVTLSETEAMEFPTLEQQNATATGSGEAANPVGSGEAEEAAEENVEVQVVSFRSNDNVDDGIHTGSF